MDYIKSYTDMSFLVKDEYAFKDGFFSGYDAEAPLRQVGLGIPAADGYVKIDPTADHAACGT